MNTTQNLKLPYIMAAQAQKHVTHNEALRMLDAIVQLSVLDKDLTLPPGAPNDGDRYIVANGGSADWSGHDGAIAAWQDGAWAIYQPETGWQVWVADENSLYVYDGSAWVAASSGGGSGSVNPTPLVGVNATADATNRLSVSSDASLFNHDGSDHQQKINKAAVGDTASQLYQTNFSGRAEIGLTGDDDFHFKVSPDGAAFHEAIVIDKDDGRVEFPNTPVVTNMLFNLFEDAGRFAGTPEDQGVSAGSYVAPSYLATYNGATFSAGDRFIHNNTTYGGSGGALGADVDELIQFLRPGSTDTAKRYGVEFYVMDIGVGAGTLVPIVIGATTHYLVMTNAPVPFWAKSTLSYNLKCKSGKAAVRYISWADTYIDGVLISSSTEITPADGWVQVVIVYDYEASAFAGYNNIAASLYATPSSELALALPVLFPGQITPNSVPIGAIPSLRAWR